MDEELLRFREADRGKIRKRRIRDPAVVQEVNLGDAGADRGFKGIENTGKDRVKGRLGGDEAYYSS